MRKPRVHVRHSTPTVFAGQKYRSIFEALVAEQLHDAGVIFEYERASIHYNIPRIYLPDFKIGASIFIEVKGYFPPEDRRKLLAVKDANPALDLRLVFQRAKGRATKTLSYGDWATRHGFKWADTKIPKHWFDEAEEQLSAKTN